MPENVLNSRKLQYVEALLVSRTKKEAAEKVGITPRQARRYMEDPEVQAALHDLQDAVIDEAGDRCAALALEALDVIAAIMSDEANAPGTRLVAAKLVLENSARMVEQVQIVERLAALEARLDEERDEEALGGHRGQVDEPAGAAWRHAGLDPALGR